MASVAIERARRCRLRVGSVADAECLSGLALLVFLDPQPALVLGDKTAALFHNQVHGWFP